MMINRIFTAFIIIVAVIAGMVPLLLPHEDMMRIALFREFFYIAIPILAFGALIKYLGACSYRRCTCGCSCCGVNVREIK